ncbi:hypothetical protein FFLO_00675 [Filobasidium floriforme]|uniref:PQ-loop repeat-containing protein 1 n=1 Tax=Filobasidium floriforme TaxID=5210 RepID=A0A8K0JVT9_9TREE|nr:uncharacterized protein HD553DRAFT_309263 [Filobasidium floriforme]KAG7571323.1 hypothetical protein FFLO_00675 [Filobasidium floriforme]KAH8086274.1 hypothetical protein HD553DRAFT_309263 [Filobasidium floriforme]
MGFIGDLAAVGMAVGPPLIYVDQVRKILKARDSSGFSIDICAVVIIANITRCFFYLGHRFETSLIVQSILLITSQLFLLSLCIHNRPTRSSQERIDNEQQSFASRMLKQRPFNFWQWDRLGSYLEFLAGFIVVMVIIHFALGWSSSVVESLGLIALGLESTLPIPQLLSNYRRRSTEGFSDLVLAGWLGGDIFKTGFYLARHSPMQFTICGAITVLLDLCVLAQRLIYRDRAPQNLPEDEQIIGAPIDHEHELALHSPYGDMDPEDDSRQRTS